MVGSVVLAAACGDDGGSKWDSNGASTGSAAGTSAASTGHADASLDGSADDADGSDDADDDSGGGTKLDVGHDPDQPVDGCGCEQTYIWIADAKQSTVSKINTRTLVEEGRYLTRQDGKGNPSRTSVNLAGDVAVANRHGGLVKFWADPERCVDRNGDGIIQTSSGKDDVLPWPDEECRAWFADFNTTNQRPVAWTGGHGVDACEVGDAAVWTVTSAVAGLPGTGGAGGVIAYLVDGETGVFTETVPVADFDGSGFGAYGGAVDQAGNLWFTSLGISAGQVGRIDRQTLVDEVFATPPNLRPYGITVDHLGRPWVSGTLGDGAGRFDYATNTWETVSGFGGGAGLTESPDGLSMYVASGSAVRTLDLETLAPGPIWTTNQSVKGVGFDADGFLWAVDYADPDIPDETATAFKIDVATMTVSDVYAGLDDPYTYSDMTGSALGNVTCPPAG